MTPHQYSGDIRRYATQPRLDLRARRALVDPRQSGSSRHGFTVAELLVVIAILVVLTAIILGAIHRARTTAQRLACLANLHQIGVALHAYHDAYLAFPPGCNNWPSSSGHDYRYQWLSWMALLLPYVEEKALWEQTETMETVGSQPAPALSVPFPYNWANPWDVAPGGIQRYSALAYRMRLYACPSDDRLQTEHFVQGRHVAMTSYLGVSGRSVQSWSVGSTASAGRSEVGVMVGTNKYDFSSMSVAGTVSSRGCSLDSIKDGASNTLVVGERPPSSNFDFGWWFAGEGQAATCSCDVLLGTSEVNLQPSGLAYVNCPQGNYSFGPGSVDNPCDDFHFWSLHPGGANFLFADGSALFLTYGIGGLLDALGTKNGGESVVLP